MTGSRTRRSAGRLVATTLAVALLVPGVAILVPAFGLPAPAVLPATAAATPAPSAVAATPAPTEPGVGDTRSSGEGAGFVGRPFVAIGLVIVVGLAAAGATLLYVRLTDPRRR